MHFSIYFYFLFFLNFWWLSLRTVSAAQLLVDPQFLLVEEDWPVGTHLPVTICPKNVKILSGDSSNYFSVVKINDSCSTLQLNLALDADKETADGLRGQSFSLVVAGPKKSRGTLEIQVVDVNDNPPQFINTPSSFEISENAKIDEELFKITTLDADTGISGISRFSIDGDEHFAVGKRKCANGRCSTTLRLAKPLDFESKPIHTFNITAKDGDPHSNRTHTVTHTVTVHVKNENDEPPKIITDFSKIFEIPKTANPGDTVATIEAIDVETPENGIKFEMEENENFKFTEENSGKIELQKMMEPGKVYNLNLKMTAKNGKFKKTEMQLKLVEGQPKNFENQESSSELCEFPIYEAHLVQGTGQFSTPLRIKTLKTLGNDQPRLIGGSESFDLEVLDDFHMELKILNPEKIAEQNLDNAQLLVKSKSGQCRIVLRSVAPPTTAKSAVPLKKSKMEPKFEKSEYSLQVVENREPTVIGEVKAIGDGPMNYELLGESSKKFQISAKTGEIQNLAPIDREQFERFELVVKATDQIGSSSKIPLKISVKDENDNSPIFEKPHYILNIDEGKSEKLKISATDKDDGKNAQIIYSVDQIDGGGNLPIDISPDGILFIGAIDRESLGNVSSEVNLTVTASDSGEPRRSSSVIVTLRVKDINDNPPIFSNSRYSLIVDANISPGGVIGRLQTTDSDATSPNNYVTYSSSDPRFKVADSGEILFVGPGILEKSMNLEFNVTASDGGDPVNRAIAQVVINEHRSGNSIENELTTQINSNDTGSSEKSEIKWLNAGMPGYSYEIIRASADNFSDSEVATWISIDKKSGRIETLKKIDPTKVKNIKLHISMRKGKREVPVELIINVVDTDDVTPIYSNPTVARKFSTSEAATVGTTVAVVPVEGVRNFENLKYSLKIVSGPKSKLQIDKFGTIRILRQLDFEKERKIEGTISAEWRNSNSRPKIATVPFQLTITDSNDNRPIFKNSSNFVVSIYENSVLGTVLDLPYPLAEDSDSGKFAELRYSMTGDEGFFKIDESNSTIRLVAPLDFETQRVHSLSIRCVDNQGNQPHHEVFASITVNVIDVNDNAPIIHNTDLTHLHIEEDAPVGTVVTVLVVSDSDESGKQKTSIDLNSTMFRVDTVTLQVLTDAPLIGQAGQRLCSTVTARDAGGLTATSPYCITVYPAKNTHHNPLVISPKPNSIHYFDENIVYDELLKVKVLEEEGETANVTFKLDEMFKKDWQMFSIGENNGSLRARQPFDFEKKTVHEIKILACRVDNCTSTHLFISVNDRNDNCPMFPKQDVRLTVLENEKGKRQVGRIPAALDSDFHSDNTKVCYTTDTPIFFFSDPTLPILFTNSSFDREHKKQHQITITAYDCHLSCRDPHKPINGTIVALIDVIDVNDNFPKFSEKIYTTTVIQGHVTAGSHILTVQATDLDEELDGLKFSIRGFIRSPTQSFTPSDSPISIDTSSGEVTSSEVLKDSSYSFTVVVTDGAGHEDTASVVISVVTYAQQTELVFDAPFELIMKNEKKIAECLSNATGLQTVVDKCRQNSNFTLMLVHFSDSNGQFVNVDKAVNLLMTSSAESRSELRSVYGLREAFPPVPIPSRLPQYILIAVLLFFVISIFSMCIWCRQRNNYERKLRHISAQASTVHTVTLGRNHQKSAAPLAYGEIPTISSRHHPPPAPPPPSTNLQSTEL